jgi:cell pole-organizing protein PopZ
VINAEKAEKTLTTEDVRKAVDNITERAIPRTRAPSADIEVEMDLEDSNGSEPPLAKKKAAPQEAQLILSEKGEAALNRIRKVCGDPIADAIENKTRAMTERDIRNWAEYDPEMMRQLTYFIFDRNYPLQKAVTFINKPIDDSTEVHDLLLIAHSRGGTAQLNYDNRAKITVELRRSDT